MENNAEKTPVHKPTVIIMVAVIVLFLIGIIIRWDYIKKEVTDTMQHMFPTEEAGTGK